MSRPIVILLAVVLASVALFTGAFLLASRVSSEQLSRSPDDLRWLQEEFQLGKAEMERVRELHEGYLPVCQEFCDRIADEKRSLQLMVEQGQGGTVEATDRLNEIARTRARCQAAMLQHFEEVSEVMPPKQGQRYLAEMRRLTLGFHEQIEESMSGDSGDGHAHH
jgi:hypothetical protein